VNVKLFDFQVNARDGVLKAVHGARRRFQEDKPETLSDCLTIVLSAPTGAGKTVIMASVIETLFEGHPDGDFKCVFPLADVSVLWITADPQLNTQTDQRFLSLMSEAWFGGRLINIDESSFDSEYLPTGTVCFINTQKLSSNGNLIKPSDRRRYTFWQTMTNTIRDRYQSLIVVIDEAHQGALSKAKGRDTRKSQSIMQRFLKGYSEDGHTMPPSPVIVGVSATPQRFNKLAVESGRRTVPVNVSARDVVESGLVKQQIRLRHAPGSDEAGMTLLQSALDRHGEFVKAWQAHSRTGNVIKPVVLVQVEDGTKSQLSRTDLDQVFATIRRNLSPQQQDSHDNAVVHAFQEGEKWEVGGKTVMRMEPSKINDAHEVQVVVFKTALTTGWDCPRAEVMMSFRTARDSTHIAQLVGRMVRAPLHKAVTGDGPDIDLLNGVDLYLPRFDEEGLEKVVKSLSADSAEGTGTAVQAFITFDAAFNPGIAKEDQDCIAEAVAALPTYGIEGRVKGSPVNRLMRLARRLERVTDTSPPIVHEARELAVNQLCSWLGEKIITAREAVGEDTWTARVERKLEVEVTRTDRNIETIIGHHEEELGTEPREQKTKDNQENTQVHRESVDRSDSDLDSELTRIHRRIGGSETEIALEFAKRLHRSGDETTLQKAKAAVLALLNDDTITELGDHAQELIERWARNHSEAIERLPDIIREEAEGLIRSKPEHAQLDPPPKLAKRIEMRKPKNAPNLCKHLYTRNGSASCPVQLNGWETVEAERLIADDSVIAWLRNRRTQATWSLAIPWTDSSDNLRLVYPDLLAFRHDDEVNRVVVDIVDPHALYLSDAPRKLKGLAQYAKDNANNLALGRVVVVAEVDGRRRRDLSDPVTRDTALACKTIDDIKQWFRGTDIPPPEASTHPKPDYETPSVPSNTEIYSTTIVR